MFVPARHCIVINTDIFTALDDGSMSKDKREASLEKIRNSKTTRCILISFKAGSTGELCGFCVVLQFSTVLVFRGIPFPLSITYLFPIRKSSRMFPAHPDSRIIAHPMNPRWCSREVVHGVLAGTSTPFFLS